MPRAAGAEEHMQLAPSGDGRAQHNHLPWLAEGHKAFRNFELNCGNQDDVWQSRKSGQRKKGKKMQLELVSCNGKSKTDYVLILAQLLFQGDFCAHHMRLRLSFSYLNKET